MGWDKGVNFDEIYSKIRMHMKLIRSRLKNSGRYQKRLKKQLLYDSVLVTQLVNGCRISEAIEALNKFIKSGKREIRVTTRKKKTDEKRLVIIPSIIPNYDRHILPLLTEDKNTVSKISHYCMNTYGINTHTLRYAGITKHARLFGPSIAAKITKHSRLDYILKYTQERAAEDYLKAFVESLE